MKLKPLADNILLKQHEAEETTTFGIILATTNKEKPAIYEVVSAGPGTKDVAVTVKPGDKVVVGQYIGSTAPKVKAKVQEALGGILFIDEAYALAKGGENDYGKEAIDTLVADIENYRKDLMVIIAGYSDDMDIFLRQNQGLSSRFPNEIIFEDYTPEELLSIFKSNIASRGLLMDSSLEPLALQLIAKHSGKADFGNARGVRNLVDKVSEQRNVRIARLFTPGHTPTKEELQTVIQEDLEYFL